MLHVEYGDSSDRARDPERSLIASVLGKAMDDMQTGSAMHAAIAYRWVINRDKWFVIFCELLDLNVENVRDAVIKRFGFRCESILRKQRT